jgi:outer membrane protein
MERTMIGRKGIALAALVAIASAAEPQVLAAQSVTTMPGAGSAAAAADTVPLTLDGALARALDSSEEVGLARARMEAASARSRSAWSNALPQVNTQLAYTKALRSVFQSAGGGFTVPDSLQFDPDPSLPLEERVRYLERRTPGAALGALGSLFSDLPFGNENTWIAGLSLSQPVFAGGRIKSSIEAAAYAEDGAAAAYDDASSDIVLQVRQAYYDAALATSTVEIVQSSVDLARAHLEQVRLRERAGTVSELDVLRADVELENLVPQLVQARNARDVALLNLKRLLNLPADAALDLTTALVPPDETTSPVVSADLPPLDAVQADLRTRASVRAAEAQVAAANEQVDIAKSAYLPSVSLTANLTRQAFPGGTFGIPGANDWRDDWSVGFAVQWPLFQGLRRTAQVDEAQASRHQAELQLAQLREAVSIEYEQAQGELERAQAQIAAAQRTVDQAQRVYELTEMRFEQGLTTQLEVEDARLSLQQARLNRVQAYHAAHVALARAERALGVSVAPAQR